MGHAQETDDDDVVVISEPDGQVTLLDRITVVSRTGDTPIDTMASVSHVGEEQLERRMASTPNDLLFGIPGVTMQTDSQRVGSAINIRGLQDFGRVAVLVDGARQNFQVSGHGTESLVFIDPLLIQQVDVIRGPVANTYGSGAIGGVVAFETKDAGDFLRPDETWAGSLTGTYETNGEGMATSAIGAIRLGDSADIIANLIWRDYGNYEDGDGNTVSGTSFDVLSGMAKATVRPTEFSELKLGWIGADDNWGGISDDEEYDLQQNTLTARYHVTDPGHTWLDLHINGSFNNTDLDHTDLTASETTNYDLQTYGLDIWNTSRFTTGMVDHEVTYGGDWMFDDVVTMAPGGGSDLFTPSGERQVWGAYIEDKITYDWLEVVGGLRYDSYKLEGDGIENSGDRISPRITVGVSPFEGPALGGFQVYGTYAEGYRSPSVTETLVSGLHPFPPFPFLPNPDLKPETAKTWEFGINYSRDGVVAPNDSLRLKAAYFHNDIDDFIDFVQVAAPPTCGPPWFCFQNQNFASAKIEGFEMEAAYDAGRSFGGLSVSIIDGYRVTGGVREDLASIPSAQVTANAGMRFLDKKLTVGGEVQYNDVRASAPYPHDYTLVNLFANYRATENVSFNARVDNLFDVKYANPLNDATSTVFEPGLNIKLSATVRFGG